MPIEVIKVQEVEKIVEVFKDRFIPAKEEDCDCLTGMRFINVWNRLFQIKGESNDECLTEDEFIHVIQRNLNQNAKLLQNSNAKMSASTTSGFRSTVMTDATAFQREHSE